MLGLIAKLFQGVADPGPRERIGETDVDPGIGDEILAGTQIRKGFVSRIRERMAYIKREDLPELVDRMLRRFALYVVDLPASEKDHHSQPYGLLDHSLEVASEAVAGLAGSSFRISPDPLLDYKDRPAWVYAGLIAALGHDLGKVLDYSVTVEGRTWEPTRESLAAFLCKRGRSKSGPDTWTFRPGRGLEGNVDRNADLLRLILPPSAISYLGNCLNWIGKLYISQSNKDSTSLPEPARRIKELVGIADRTTSRQNFFESRAEVSVAAAESKPAPSEAKACPATPEGPSEDSKPAFVTSESSPEESTLGAVDTDEAEEIPHDESIADRRDSKELQGWSTHELDPATLLDTIRRQIHFNRLQTNGTYSPVYVTRDRVWLVLPAATDRLAKILRLRGTADVKQRILASLSQSPQVERTGTGELLWRIKPHPNDPYMSALALRTRGFLSDFDRAKLKEWHFEIVIWRPAAEGDVASSRMAS